MIKSRKPVVLVFPFDLLSHYTRCIQLAQSIQDEFDISFNSSKKYDVLVKEAGFKTFTCDSFDAREVMDDSRKFKFDWLNYNNLKRVFLAQVKVIEDLKPTAVFADTAPTLKMAAEYTNTLHISLMNGYLTKYYAKTRTISKDHPAAQYQDRLPEGVFDRMTRIGEYVAFTVIERAFYKLRKEFKLGKKKYYLDELEGDINYICDDPDLFPQNNLPENYHIIGPLYYHSKKKEPEIQRTIENGIPTLLVNMGSSGDLHHFSFLNYPEFLGYNIIITGGQNDVIQGKNVIYKKFINNSAVLDHVDLVLCHGGNGTIYQSLAYGVPVVCATSIFEQEWNAHRVQELNYGVCLDKVKSTEEKLKIVQAWLGKKHTNQFKAIKQKFDVFKTINTFRESWIRDVG